MTAATDTDIQQIKDLIVGLDKKIEALDKKVDIGFAQLEKKIDVGLAEVKGEIKNLDTKLEEKTKNLEGRISSWEGATTRLSIAILTGLLLTFAKFLFFGKLS